MKHIFKYIPSVVFAIIEIWITLIILDNSEYSSDSRIMAGLVLIYASIRTFAIGIGMSLDNLIVGLSRDIIDIKERIKADVKIEEDREVLKETVQKVSTSNTKLIIRSIGITIIYLIALSSLLG